VGLIPDVIGCFNWPNPSSCTMALGLTQPLTEMSTRNLPGGKGQVVRKNDNFTAICELTVYKMWEPWHLTTLWTSMACYRNSYTFLSLDVHDHTTCDICCRMFQQNDIYYDWCAREYVHIHVIYISVKKTHLNGAAGWKIPQMVQMLHFRTLSMAGDIICYYIQQH
jgi:hypothetical protein